MLDAIHDQDQEIRALREENARLKQRVVVTIALARKALEPFATGETNVRFIPFEYFRAAARVWRLLGMLADYQEPPKP